MMRFRGGGVGHASTREATEFFKQDRDSRDAKRGFDEDNEDYDQTQQDQKMPNQSREDRHDEEEDYGYNRGQFSDRDEEEWETEEFSESDDEFEPDNDGGDAKLSMDNFGYGEM